MIRGVLDVAARRPLLSLSALTLVLLFIRGTDQSFWAFDEGWYAQQARWILQNNDWITQHWWGSLQYDRGMGIQWLIAASYAVFGYSETTARLPAMMAAFGCVLLTYGIARECIDRRTALLAAAILSVTPIWMQAARLATQDVPLVFFELLGIWALLRVERDAGGRIAWGILAGATIGLGFMIKTFMVVPALVAMAPYLLIEHRRHRHLANAGLYLGLLIGFVPFLVWMGLSIEAYGSYPFDNMIGKLLFLSGEAFHREGPLYYFWNVPVNAFPWALLAVPGFVLAIRGRIGNRHWLWIGYPVLLFLLLSLFKTRVWYYALQLLPFIAVGAAVALLWLTDTYAAGRARLPLIASAIFAGVGLVMTMLGAGLIGGVLDIGREPAWAFGLLGIVAGVALLAPLLIVLLDRRSLNHSTKHWLAGWLLGPWLAIAITYATGLWGNYVPDFKKRMQVTEITSILTKESVDFVIPDSHPADDLDDQVLLVLYTPEPGRKYSELSAVPDGNYAWVDDETLKSAQRPVEAVGRVRGWTLVRAGNR